MEDADVPRCMKCNLLGHHSNQCTLSKSQASRVRWTIVYPPGSQKREERLAKESAYWARREAAEAYQAASREELAAYRRLLNSPPPAHKIPVPLNINRIPEDIKKRLVEAIRKGWAEAAACEEAAAMARNKKTRFDCKFDDCPMMFQHYDHVAVHILHSHDVEMGTLPMSFTITAKKLKQKPMYAFLKANEQMVLLCVEVVGEDVIGLVWAMPKRRHHVGRPALTITVKAANNSHKFYSQRIRDTSLSAPYCLGKNEAFDKYGSINMSLDKLIKWGGDGVVTFFVEEKASLKEQRRNHLQMQRLR